MIELLYEKLTKLQLIPTILKSVDMWDSLIINRRKPYTYRVFTQIDDVRICLHKFEKCDEHEAFLHPHSWPGAFIILDGAYKMKVGFSEDRISQPKHFVDFHLSKYSSYQIDNPLIWHSVIPLTTTYTVMINKSPWPIDYAHKDIRTTKGKDLEKMPENELIEHLNKFKILINQWTAYRLINKI